MPYTSYFSNEQSVSDQWGLSVHDAKKVFEVWKDACEQLDTTYSNELIDDVQGYFKQKLAVYDVAHTTSSYKIWDQVIFDDQFKKLVDIQRAMVVLRAFCTGGQKDAARENFKTIWVAIKTKVGTGAAAEGLAKKFNVKYCPDEFMHYLHYLVKSPKEPSTMKPWVSKQNGTLNLRVWHKK